MQSDADLFRTTSTTTNLKDHTQACISGHRQHLENTESMLGWKKPSWRGWKGGSRSKDCYCPGLQHLTTSQEFCPKSVLGTFPKPPSGACLCVCASRKEVTLPVLGYREPAEALASWSDMAVRKIIHDPEGATLKGIYPLTWLRLSSPQRRPCQLSKK